MESWIHQRLRLIFPIVAVPCNMEAVHESFVKIGQREIPGSGFQIATAGFARFAFFVSAVYTGIVCALQIAL
jgi:hypothetical protein